MAEKTKKERAQQRVSAMRSERLSFDAHYMELSENIQPRRGRFFTSDRNKGEKRHQLIINSRGTQALRTATAGLLAGTMSPSRPWFALATPDPDLMEFAPVREWLYKTETLLRAIFNASNLYNMAPVMLSELLLFATGFMTHVDDFDDVARFYTHTVGSYMLAQNDRYRIDTAARDFEMTVEQLVRQFGLENVSPTVRNMWDRGNYEVWIPVTHFIYPNFDRDPRKLMLGKNKAYGSCYFESGDNDKNRMLSESGYDRFPGYAPRWGVTGEDTYGTDCPGMIALGDVKGLQIMEKRKAQAVDKMVNPPLKGPSTLANKLVSSLPGGLTLYDQNGVTASDGLGALYQVQPNLEQFARDLDRTERRIDEAFYVPLWLAISNMEGVQPRNAFELQQRDQERLLQLGPVLERLHGEFLSPLIDNTFEQCVKAGILPEPPPELQETPLKIEYISTLAQAQRAVATNSIDRLTAFTAGLVKSGWSQAGDKIDVDQAIDEYAQVIGVPPRIIVSDENVQLVRAERKKAEEAQQSLMMAQAGAQIAKTAADTKTGELNLLTRATGQDDEAAEGEA